MSEVLPRVNGAQLREGQLFRCGPHLLGCGDLLEGHFEQFFNDETYEWVYSDPPWGEGLARYFRTMNDQWGDPRYAELLDRWADVASRATHAAYGEMGLSWRDELVVRMEARGAPLVREYTAMYGSPKKPSLLQVFSRHGESGVPDQALNKLGGMTLVKRALSIARPGETVADPMIGFGMTLKAGHYGGLRVLGLELVPKRLAGALEWCAKKGMFPELVADLSSSSA